MTAARGRRWIPSFRTIGRIVVSTASASYVMAACGTAAWSADGTGDAAADIASHEIMLTAALTGVVIVAVASVVGMMRARSRAEETIDRIRADAADLKMRLDRAEVMLSAEDQVTLSWSRADEPPMLAGALGSGSVPKSRSAFLAFGSWLSPSGAGRLEHAIADLRETGVPFQIELETLSGGYVEVVGRPGAGRPFVRFRDLSAERRQHADLAIRHQRLVETVSSLRSLLDGLDMPVWCKDAAGRLTWVNAAYAKAVEQPTAEAVLRQGDELLDAQGRKAIERQHEQKGAVSARLPVIVAGQRRIYDVVNVLTHDGAAGIATDVSALENIQAELRRTIDFHARTLDQLATAVAIFGPDRRLQFYNAAYRTLWGLDAAFLESHPEDGVILDEIRASRRLPEQADFRGWKRDLLSSYRSLEAREHWWHLPDGQTLRVIANPHPLGGVTYVYENVTERLELEKRNNALVSVQGETLDHLSEGVAVFGSDGKLRLWNPPFAALWKLDRTTLVKSPHISDIITWCAMLHNEPETWRRVQQAVAGLADNRVRFDGRIDRRDGTVLEYATVPLPDGATLITFVNVTDTVNVERALTEKAEALMEADRVKTDFVGLVSYELRSPLTNIIGFATLLEDPKFGDLNPRQRDYARHIMSSSQALVTIVDDILDLATIDAGIMELQLSDVDIGATIAAAIEGVKDRVESAHLTLVTDVPEDIGSFEADEKRVRQLMFNLIANAVRFSSEAATVGISARREGSEIVLMVADQGIGIPEDQLRLVFDRFFARRQGPHRSGAGLGLSVVKSFVELHGGTIEIMSQEGRGTTVTCRFPERQTRSPQSVMKAGHG